ncbi:organic solvent ABC transporter, partial [Xanthomonas oryzae pv. oryzae]
MKTTLLSAVLASTLLVCAPATVLAQPAAASAPTQ